MDNHLKKVKILFSVITLLLIVSMISGGFVIKNNALNAKKFSQAISYLSYKVSFAYTGERSFVAGLTQIFNFTNRSIKNSNNKAKSIPILLYHGVVNKSDNNNILLDNFKGQMFALKDAGWQTINIDDFYKFIKGEKELPDKSFLLTFDDGRKDSYYSVDPILKALGYNAVIFIITEHSLNDKESNFYLSEGELKNMIKSGRWEVQTHTDAGHDFIKIDSSGKEGHFYSNKMWRSDDNRLETDEEYKKRISDDLELAKNKIKDKLGVDSTSFAFPFGDFGQESTNISNAESVVPEIIKSIYPILFYQTWTGKGFSFNYPNNDAILSERISVKTDWSADDLIALLESSKEKNIPYIADFSKSNGWQKGWGRIDFKDNYMSLGYNNVTTGSSVFLDGSYSWKNYAFSSKINWTKGSNVFLLARYQDDSNYVACDFSNNSIKVEQFLKGEKKILSEVLGDFKFVGENNELGISVKNNTLSCYIDGKNKIDGYITENALSNGGIGFKTWDSEINNSEIIVERVNVEEIK